MSADGDFRRIGIVGVGLIGGSLAFAIRRAFPDATVIGVDRDDVTLVARQLGAIQAGARAWRRWRTPTSSCWRRRCAQNLAALAELGGIVRGPALITDVGSTKRATSTPRVPCPRR